MPGLLRINNVGIIFAKQIKMKISKTISLLMIVFAGLQSCYYDVEEELYPSSGGCDTANITLANKVKPILQGQCYACHSAANAGATGAGINVETYTNLKAQVDNGKLLKSIKHESGASAMPKGSSSKMDACEIMIIEKWVSKGAPNN
jgi:uncharacterized membrane protein